MKNSLRKKLQIKEEFSVMLMNSNPSVHPLFEGARIELNAASDQDYDSMILFTRNEDKLKRWTNNAKKEETRNLRIRKTIKLLN